MNTIDEDQTIVAHGKHFAFKSQQIKPFLNDKIADFILRERKQFGFVEVPKLESVDEGEIDSHSKDPKVLASVREQGIRNYTAFLRAQLYNLQVSLKKDLDLKGLRADPRSFATDKDLEHMEKLIKYQTTGEDPEQKKIDRIRELEKKLVK